MAKATPPSRPAKRPQQKSASVPSPGQAQATAASARNVTPSGTPKAEPVHAVALSTQATPSTPVAAAAASAHAASPAAAPKPSASASSSRAVPAAAQASHTQAAKAGNGGLIAAGLAGGLVAVAAMAVLQASSLFGAADDEAQALAAVAALEQRLDGEVGGLRTEWEQASNAAPAPVDEAAMGALQDELQALTARIDDMESGLATIAQSDADALIDRNAQDLAALRDNLDGLRTAQDEAAAAISERLDAVETEIAAPGADELVARAIAAAGLKSAIDRGGSFTPELQAYASMAPDDAAVTALDGFAEAGVPTHNALADRFPDVARAIIQSQRGADDDGMIDRLWSSARSVVTVRQTGDVEGDTTEAIIARMETRLNEGQLQAAMDEWERLPETAKAVSEEFAGDVRARIEADAIVAQTLSSAMQQTTN